MVPDTGAARTWTVDTTISPAVGVAAVACSSGVLCTAVGDAKTGPDLVSQRWDGATWIAQRMPSPPPHALAAYSLDALSCPAANDCTAVGGDNTYALIFAWRWNGSRWTYQRLPRPNGNNENLELSGLSCTSASFCMAVGDRYVNTEQRTVAESWNGKRWAVLHTRTPTAFATSGASLDSVSCVSRGACIAVGQAWNYGHGRHFGNSTFAERWDGKNWSVVLPVEPFAATPSGAGSDLRSVSCSSADACTAVGYYSQHKAEQMLAERWSGKAWTIERSHSRSPGGELAAVSCTARSACTAVGETDPLRGQYYGNAVIERWNSAGFAMDQTPTPPRSTTSELTSVSCASSAACTATGAYEAGGVASTFAEHSS